MSLRKIEKEKGEAVNHDWAQEKVTTKIVDSHYS